MSDDNDMCDGGCSIPDEVLDAPAMVCRACNAMAASKVCPLCGGEMTAMTARQFLASGAGRSEADKQREHVEELARLDAIKAVATGQEVGGGSFEGCALLLAIIVATVIGACAMMFKMWEATR
jgi:hypothetical protein